MRCFGWVLGSILLSAALHAASPSPPVPPRDDDDPFCTRHVDVTALGEALARLRADADVDAWYGSGARLVAAVTRRCHGPCETTWSTDFRFWLGPDAREGFERFRILRLTRRVDAATGDVKWQRDVSGVMVIEAPSHALLVDGLAGTRDALDAVAAVLADGTMRAVLDGLLPYHTVVSVTASMDADFASGRAIPVTIALRNVLRPAQHVRIVVDVTRDMVGTPRIKGSRCAPEGGEE